MFNNYCKNGDLDSLKTLYSTESVDIHVRYDIAFRYACSYGHKNIAKWLISFDTAESKVDIHVDNDIAFRYACRNGHKDIAKWLISFDTEDSKVDIHADGDSAFQFVCRNGHKDIAKWLISLNTDDLKIDIHAYDDYAFQLACRNGHEDIVKWLISLNTDDLKIDIHADNDYAFRYACRNGHKKIAEFVRSLSSDLYKFDIDINCNIVNWKVINQLDRFIMNKQWTELCDHHHMVKYGTNIERDDKIKDRIDQCVICYEEPSEFLIITQCLHIYCVDCFFTCYDKEQCKCGLCRADFKLSKCMYLDMR